MIDGYVTKDELYRLMSNIKMNPDMVVDDKTCSAIVEAISDMPKADIQPVDRWISVKDRLPESEKEVLVWYRWTWGAGFVSHRFGISKWYSNIKRWDEGFIPKSFEVLYWQPLPETPKDGDVE